jgi:hypothetical protein
MEDDREVLMSATGVEGRHQLSVVLGRPSLIADVADHYIREERGRS